MQQPINPLLPAKPRRSREEEAAYQLAMRIAFATRVLGRCMPAEARWLQDYEKEHGKVAG